MGPSKDTGKGAEPKCHFPVLNSVRHGYPQWPGGVGGQAYGLVKAE